MLWWLWCLYPDATMQSFTVHKYHKIRTFKYYADTAALCPHPILSTDRPFCPVHIKVALLNNIRAPFFSQSVPYLEQAAACSQPHPLHLSDRGWLMFLPALSPASPCLVSPRKHSWLVNSWKRFFAKTEKAPTKTFSWLKAPATAFTFKTLLRQY